MATHLQQARRVRPAEAVSASSDFLCDLLVGERRDEEELPLRGYDAHERLVCHLCLKGLTAWDDRRRRRLRRRRLLLERARDTLRPEEAPVVVAEGTAARAGERVARVLEELHNALDPAQRLYLAWLMGGVKVDPELWRRHGVSERTARRAMKTAQVILLGRLRAAGFGDSELDAGNAVGQAVRDEIATTLARWRIEEEAPKPHSPRRRARRSRGRGRTPS
jgi:hypothetical protein